MTPSLPELSAGGFTSFNYQLMRDSRGRPVLMSQDVVQLYLAYVAIARQRKEEPQSFSDWVSSADVLPAGSVHSRGAS